MYPVTQQEGASSEASAHKPRLKYMWEPVAPEMRSCDPPCEWRVKIPTICWCSIWSKHWDDREAENTTECHLDVSGSSAANCTDASGFVFQWQIQCKHTFGRLFARVNRRKLKSSPLQRCALGVFRSRSHNILKSFSAGRKPLGWSGPFTFYFCCGRLKPTRTWLRKRAAVLEKNVWGFIINSTGSKNEVINISHDSIWNNRVLLMLGSMEERVNHSLKSCEMLITICLGNHSIWICFRRDALCWAMIKTWVTIRDFQSSILWSGS